MGCGAGTMIQYLKNKGAGDILGIDISREQLAICKKYVSENVIETDVIEFLRRNESRYDLITAIDFIEHLKKDTVVEFVQLVFKTLTEGGIAIIRTPNMGSMLGSYSRYVDFTHEVGFTEESIQQIFHLCHYRDVRVFNSYCGIKRLVALTLFARFIELLYNNRHANVITKNMILIASK